MKRLCYIFSLLLIVEINLFCQKAAKISIGIAFPELSNIKISNADPFQISIGFGYMPYLNASSVSTGISYYFPN
jgi:hypothetical protein